MKRSGVTAFAIVALFATAALAAATDANQDGQSPSAIQGPVKGPGPGKTILWFDVMYGVDGPFLEEENAIRGIPGDELPWEIEGSVQGKLDTNGRLSIHVKGLVFTDDDIVPPDLRGTNDESHFRGLVSCLSETDEDTIVVRNVVTPPFPANSKGDSRINAKIQLPESCIAPIIMVLAGSENKWFAVTGFEAEEEEDGD